MANLLTRIFGSRNQRLLRNFSKVVNNINDLEEGLRSLSDEAIKAKTDEFRGRYKDGETLDDLLRRKPLRWPERLPGEPSGCAPSTYN